MNLYKIEFEHSAPERVEKGMKCLLLAKDDEQVYEWIASKPEISYGYICNNWKRSEENGNYDVYGIYDKYNNRIGVESFREKITRSKGDIHDENWYSHNENWYSLSSIVFGWKLLKENVTTDYKVLYTVFSGLYWNYEYKPRWLYKPLKSSDIGVKTEEIKEK